MRILPCSAWEGSWDEPLIQLTKYTLTWVFATGSGPLASAVQRERRCASLPEVVRLTVDLCVGSAVASGSTAQLVRLFWSRAQSSVDG